MDHAWLVVIIFYEHLDLISLSNPNTDTLLVVRLSGGKDVEPEAAGLGFKLALTFVSLCKVI